MRGAKPFVLPFFAAAVCLATTNAPAATRTKGDVQRFATVPPPGSPEPVVIAPDGTVYTATLNAESGDTSAPSKVFAFSPDGKLQHEWTIKGQDTSKEHGLTGMAMDSDGRLYIGSLSPPAVFHLDPRTGAQQTYATYRDVPVCSATVSTDCSKAMRDLQPWPDYIVLAPDGTLYETDSLQALIWRVPPGGGRGEVWFTDPRVQSLTGPPGFGPSALKLMPDGKTLMFSTVEGPTGDGDPTAGRLWKLPILPGNKPGELKEFYTAQSADAPGGIGFAKSGKLFVALTGSSQIAEIGPDGKEIARFPDPLTNQTYSPPLDGPIDVAFRGSSLLVANSAYVSNSSSSWALLDVFVGEPGYDPLRPKMTTTTGTTTKPLTLSVRPKRVTAGKRVRLRFRVTSARRPIRGAHVRVGRTHVRTDARGRAGARLVVHHAGRHQASASKDGYRPTHATFAAIRRR
jgi:sugar lactone lactonase YvrE